LKPLFPKFCRPAGLVRFSAGGLLAMAGFFGFIPLANAGGDGVQGEADAAAHWELVLSPYAYHWSDSEAHRNVYLIGAERKLDNGRLAGVSFFRNSFGQPSVYGYYGKQWDAVLGQPSLFFKLSGGVIYGYKGAYANKIPYNHHGFGVAAIPAVGWQFDSANAVQMAMLGTAALIFTYNHGF
jgi:hypothetical protein